VADAYDATISAEPEFRAARLTETTPPIVVPEGNLLR
jgi:hypothetical protein